MAKTKKVKGSYVNINTPDGNLPHHFFSTEEMEIFFRGCEIIYNEYVDEYSYFMKKKMNHLIFICNNN